MMRVCIGGTTYLIMDISLRAARAPPRPIPEFGIVRCAGRFVTRALAIGHHHIYSTLARGMPPPARPPRSFVEILEQCESQGIAPAAVVHTSSSGGTHAGLLAGQAMLRDRGDVVPEVLAIGVAKGVNLGLPDIAELAGECVELIGGDPSIVDRNDVRLDPDWMGDDYGVPTRAGDAAIKWAARHGGCAGIRVYPSELNPGGPESSVPLGPESS